MIAGWLYYKEALTALNVAPLKDHFDRAWIAHVELKASLFYGETCYRYSLELHEKEEFAEEIARLRSAVTALSELKFLYLLSCSVSRTIMKDTFLIIEFFPFFFIWDIIHGFLIMRLCCVVFIDLFTISVIFVRKIDLCQFFLVIWCLLPRKYGNF